MASSNSTGSEREPSTVRMLRAAIDEFETHGFAGARVDRIAAAAKANKQLVYRHFGDKQGLYEAVIGELISKLRAVDEDSAARGESYLQALAPPGGRPQDAATVRRQWARILSWEGLQPLDRSEAAVRFIRENYTRYVAELEDDDGAANAVKRFPPRYVYTLILAAVRLPHTTPAAFAAALGKEAATPDDLREWFEFVRDFVSAIGDSDDS